MATVTLKLPAVFQTFGTAKCLLAPEGLFSNIRYMTRKIEIFLQTTARIIRIYLRSRPHMSVRTISGFRTDT